MNKVIKIINDPNLSDSEKVAQIRGIFSMKHISDTGLGYLVRLPNKRSKFFRYAPAAGDIFTNAEQKIKQIQALNAATGYKNENSK